MKQCSRSRFVLVVVLLVGVLGYSQGLTSLNVGSTVTKVRVAKFKSSTRIIASNYNGNIIALNYVGNVLWETVLSEGVMNHEIWVDDLDNDGYDEILAANANGTLYCLNYEGAILWEFKQNNSPLISVCVIHKVGGVNPYIACGGNDLSIYYVSKDGDLIKEIPSSSYLTTIRPNSTWVDDGTLPYNVHSVNFLRPIPQSDGSDHLLLHGIVANTDANGEFFEFEPDAVTPLNNAKKVRWGPIGDLRVRKVNGNNVLLMGFSGIKKIEHLGLMDLNTKSINSINLDDIIPKLLTGYRVTQTDLIEISGQEMYFVLMGERIYLIPTSLNLATTQVLIGSFSFNDMVYDKENHKIILGSIQSGGNQIHIIDLQSANWKSEFEAFQPGGTIASIIENSNNISSLLKTYQKPSWERNPLDILMMSEAADKKLSAEALVIKKKYSNLKFMGYKWMTSVYDWDRSGLESETLRNQRDSRKNYSLTESEVVDQLSSGYNAEGLATWGGHGVDPFMFGPAETIKKVVDRGSGKRSVWIWPELTILHKETFGEVLEKLFYPLGEYANAGNNLKLFLRPKHVFWQSVIYKKEWSRFLSGEFANVLVPALEETLDQTQDLSLAGRLGLWASGVCNEWGTRAVRDNASYMRNRQFSHQNLPNHFLRNSIFHTAYGARYINNFALTSDYSEYMTLLWELLGSGALYIPKVDEIVSFSPVHLSMLEPEEIYLREGNSMDATVRYNNSFHPNNPFVFNRLSSDWSGAQVPGWDFSSYASGVKDRRSNFLAPYPNGMVLITPPQKGVYVQENKVREALENRLHPFYKGRLKEFYTDGRYYYSADGTEKYNAKQYASVIETEIKQAAKELPINVSGNVAWVVAQTNENHFRLTLIDKGYLNPKDRIAEITFNNVTPVKIKDLVTGENIKVGAMSTSINVSAGMFRFIDIEFKEWNSSLSSKEVMNNNTNTIYPVPTKDYIIINKPEKVEDYITITDVLGNTVIKKYIKKEKNKTYRLNVSNLNSGIYFLQLKGSFHKIIKND
ncbi:T9SS type A sorting domain-containing protein [Wenyingzhuangia aestuarii]|uniref:T9SS type A sorting domain-containing protein n=1 Tax=Wenyingzhuangia aestuarii TaxID=1647582 RepID=UPI00143A2CCD|nr:T9SS type A sorting domain-containing protein [Wenyingzhuangia aestuarii]NJB83032.1 hypothetical protein [Wenyingzhuangia aestuarii]